MIPYDVKFPQFEHSSVVMPRDALGLFPLKYVELRGHVCNVLSKDSDMTGMIIIHYYSQTCK